MLRTPEIKAALRARFCEPEWALFFEVADATGVRQQRYADAVAMNLYPSRGLEINGFEVKASRQDWTRELKNPEKSAPVQRYCDRWWIVAPAGVIQVGELPPTWGQYEAQPGGKLRQIVAAPKLEAVPVTRDFVAAMLRRASSADEGVIEEMVRAKVDAAREKDGEHIKREIDGRSRRLKELQDQVNEIERISGVKIGTWGNSEEIGRAVRAVMTAGVLQSYGGIQGMRNTAVAVLKQLDEALDLFPLHAKDEDAPEMGLTDPAPHLRPEAVFSSPHRPIDQI